MNEKKRFSSNYYEEDGRVITDDGKELTQNEVVDLLNQLNKENEQLKFELSIYRYVAYCGNCKYHNYEWDVNDGYRGYEYEVCDKGNNVSDGICEEWEML
ncbi:hypothetical protein [Methanobrevibacter sp.]